MKKPFAYAAWLIVSLVFLAVLRAVVRYEIPGYSALVMGVAYAAVIYAFFVIKKRLSDRPS